MRISRVKIEGYRSIRSLELECDQPLVILEGRNDTGKSNIVEAIDLCLRGAIRPLDEKFAVNLRQEEVPDARVSHGWGQDTLQSTLIAEGAASASVSVELTLTESEVQSFGAIAVESETDPHTPANKKRVSMTWTRAPVNITSTLFGEERLRRGFSNPAGLIAFVRALSAIFRLVGPQRLVMNELFDANQKADLPPRWTDRNLKNLLFGYKNHEHEVLQARYERLRSIVRETPIGELLVGARQQQLFARTKVNDITLDLEDRSTGVQQLLAVLAAAVCNHGQIVAIEEPELNLSLELQRTLWQQLRSLVHDGTLSQLFVTSHSPLFELEAERFEVTRGPDNGTRCTKRGVGLAPALPELSEAKVTRDGNLSLSPEIAARLGIAGETGSAYVYTRSDQVGVRLLSSAEVGRLAMGEFKLEDLD